MTLKEERDLRKRAIADVNMVLVQKEQEQEELRIKIMQLERDRDERNSQDQIFDVYKVGFMKSVAKVNINFLTQ